MFGATQLTVEVTFSPREVVAFEPHGGEVDEGSIEAFSAGRSFSLLAAGPPNARFNPEGMFSDRKRNPNVYLIRRTAVPGIGEDTFWSWDFRSSNFEMTLESVRTKSDWPVAMIFKNDASVNLAKRYYSGRKLQGAMWGNVIDSGPHPPGHTAANRPWDRDEGAHKGRPCYGDKYHYRVYGGNPDFGGDDGMFNTEWGFYVIATAHIDHNEDDKWFRLLAGEVCWGTSFGQTETAMAVIERDIRAYNMANNLVRDTISPDTVNLYNGANDKQGNRILENDGRATDVCLADELGNGCIEEF